MGQEQLSLWANACQEVNKPIYLRIPSANIKYNISDLCKQWLQLSTNWLLAFFLFLILIPFLIPLVIWITFSGHQSLFTYEWRVGKRGKLFRVITLCAADIQQITSKEDLHINNRHKYMTKFMQIMYKYGVDKFPHLLNVLRGDMMLFGSKCWDLRDITSLSFEQQKQLNKMPGIISLSQ
ncbi:MAG: sugar transferase [Calothrix sp. MO_167.B42]|nr:sugar transferase [Calothrix sp. MO_167.B42]